jgi:hypothetical protein
VDSESHELDLWMQETLNNWAEQGTLPLERSEQLQMKIAKLAHQERINSLTRKACGLAAGILTCIWLLFANCPVAAASYAGNSIQSTYSCQSTLVGLFVILICFFIKHPFQFPTTNNNFEVKYE